MKKMFFLGCVSVLLFFASPAWAAQEQKDTDSESAPILSLPERHAELGKEYFNSMLELPLDELAHILFKSKEMLKGDIKLHFTSPPIFDRGFVAHVRELAEAVGTKYDKDERITGKFFWIIVYGPVSLSESRIIIGCASKPIDTGDSYTYHFETGNLKFPSNAPDETVADQVNELMLDLQKKANDAMEAIEKSEDSAKKAL